MSTPLDPVRAHFRKSRTTGPILLAVLIGLLAGGAAWTMRLLIEWARWLFQERPGELLALGFMPEWAGPFHMLFVPAIGMVLVLLITWRTPEARGSGVSEVQYAVKSRAGRLPISLAFEKALASAVSIGSGGTLGREGPIVQIGATLGSSVAQVFGLGPEQVRLLLGCGAAGAVGAIFNAPIAGVMFSLEMILGSFAARSFGLVVISSVTATALSRALLGEAPAFVLVEPFTLVSHWEFGLYLILGILTGILASVHVRTMMVVSERVETSGWSLMKTAVVGGLAVGVIGVATGGLIFDVGYRGVELAMGGEMAIGLMLGLVVARLLTTSITLSAGGSGGIFAPSLFMGAMLGGAFGQVVSRLFPLWTAPPGAYAMVGMAALFGAVAHAPITAILILFEMTGEYRIILPLLFCAVVAYLTATRIMDDSAYSFRLRRRGLFNQTGGDWSVLDLVLVADTMSEEVETVSPDATLEELETLARHRRTRSWPVSADGEHLLGIVTDTDLERALLGEHEDAQRVADIMTTSVMVCAPGESLREAFRRFTERDVQLIPVVEESGSDVLVGVLFRHDMLWAYREMSQEHERLLSRAGQKVPMDRNETVQVEYEVSASNRRVAYQHVRDIQVPPHTLVVLVRRADHTEVPRGDTRVEPGDILVLLTVRRYEDEIRNWLERP